MDLDLDSARLAMLRSEIGDELVVDLCRQYLDELRAVLADWRSRLTASSAAAAPTFGELSRIAHRLAGSGGSLGFARVRALMLDLEHRQPATERLSDADMDALDVACHAAWAAFEARSGSAS